MQTSTGGSSHPATAPTGPTIRLVDEERRARRIGSFLFGGLVGASAVLAAARGGRRRRARVNPAGLAAFEDAPCFRELADRKRPDSG